MYTSILTALFLLAVTIQLGYVLYFFSHIFGELPAPGNIIKTFKPVSVIICARNEAHNLSVNLPKILSQRYENEAGKSMYEVIVVNDASTDDTAQLLRALKEKHNNLKAITISPDTSRTLPGKKFALSQGFAAANNDLVVMTDADCMPASEQWLQMMVTPLLNGKQVVAGIGKYYPSDGILNAFIRWETLHTFLQYITYASVGKPYMAVGRNLACTKEVLIAAQQSDAWAKLPSGDDDLLMRAAANGNNTTVLTEPTSFTLSAAKDNWQDWIKQKQRHLSTGKYYKFGTQLLLGIYASSHALMWLMFFALLFTNNCMLALGVTACRCLVYWLVWAEAAKKLQEKGIGKYFLLFDIGWMIYNFAFSPYILFKNKQAWK